MIRELWYADGYLLTNNRVRDIAYDSTIYSTPAKRGADTEVAQRNGAVWRPKSYTAGGFTLNMWTYSWEGQEVALDMYRELTRVLNRQDGLIRFDRVWEDGTRAYRCYGELVQSVAPTPATDRGFRMGFEISIPGAFWEAASPMTHQSNPSASVPHSLVLTGHADATAPMDDFVYTVTGPITTPSVEVVRANAPILDKWTYNGIVVAGQTLTVNSGTWELLGTGGLVPDQSKLDYTGARYLTVQPTRPDDGQAGPLVRLRGLNAGATTRLTVTGRSKVLS